MFILRAATEEDARVIRNLVRIGQINPMGLKWERFMVAESENGDVIGCCQVKQHRDGSNELASLAVDPDWRGKGIARALIEYFLEIYPRDLYLMCRSSLGQMYEKFGFREVPEAKLPRYFQRILALMGLFERVRSDGLRVLVMMHVGDA